MKRTETIRLIETNHRVLLTLFSRTKLAAIHSLFSLKKKSPSRRLIQKKSSQANHNDAFFLDQNVQQHGNQVLW